MPGSGRQARPKSQYKPMQLQKVKWMQPQILVIGVPLGVSELTSGGAFHVII
jgi:hypothetical protein